MRGFIPDVNSQTSSNIKNMITKRAAVLCQRDRFATIEMLFFEAFMDAGAEARVPESILQCIPAQGDGVTE